MKLPTLTKLVETADWTSWKAEFHNEPARHGGGAYRVMTYAGTDQIVVMSWARNMRVVNARRIEQIRAGLRHAETGCVVKYHETAA